MYLARLLPRSTTAVNLFIRRSTTSPLISIPPTKYVHRTSSVSNFLPAATYSAAADIQLQPNDYELKKISQVLELKHGPKLFKIEPTATVYEAIEKMVEDKVGCVLVMEEEDLLGIFTERDYMTRIILTGKASKTTKVSEVMSTDVVYACPDDTVDACMAMMVEKDCRHLPVLEDGQVIGTISMRDIMRELAHGHKTQLHHLTQQVSRLAQALAGSQPP